MLTDIHYQQIIKEQLDKISHQSEIIQSAYNVLNDLAEQDSYLDNAQDEQDSAHIQEMATTASKERMAIDKYLRRSF